MRTSRPASSARPSRATLASAWSRRAPAGRPRMTMPAGLVARAADRSASSVSEASLSRGQASIAHPAARSVASELRVDGVQVADDEVDGQPQRRPRPPRHRPPPRRAVGRGPSPARRRRGRPGTVGRHRPRRWPRRRHQRRRVAGARVVRRLDTAPSGCSRDGGPTWWTPFAGTNQIRFRGSAGDPHSQRRSALPCPIFVLVDRCYTRPDALTTVGTVSATQCAPALRSRPRSAAPVSTPMAVASARRAMVMSSMASPTRTISVGFRRR